MSSHTAVCSHETSHRDGTLDGENELSTGAPDVVSANAGFCHGNQNIMGAVLGCCGRQKFVGNRNRKRVYSLLRDRISPSGSRRSEDRCFRSNMVSLDSASPGYLGTEIPAKMLMLDDPQEPGDTGPT